MVGDQLLDWVAFMCDVANSYACVFSTWKFVDTRRKIEWSNDNVDIDPKCFIADVITLKYCRRHWPLSSLPQAAPAWSHIAK